ncbi:MAG: hypothetical protein M0Z83_07360 [Betaproteobacteria bacterium]|nr:hypothetical protein [Betaproteobacteria bacterium]
MNDFFKGVSYEDAEHINSITKLSFELRENRLQVLGRHGVSGEVQLKGAIIEGVVPEHPGYEDYLSASILNMAREAIRQDLNAYLKEL